jgi:hypothetical protein
MNQYIPKRPFKIVGKTEENDIRLYIKNSLSKASTSIPLLIDLFNFMIHNPILIAKYPSFRNVVKKKLFEFEASIKTLKEKPSPQSIKEFYLAGYGMSLLLDCISEHPQYAPSPKHGGAATIPDIPDSLTA